MTPHHRPWQPRPPLLEISDLSDKYQTKLDLAADPRPEDSNEAPQIGRSAFSFSSISLAGI